MKKETVENLFEENNVVEENVDVQPVVEVNSENNIEVNPFVDLPPVAPVDYEQTTVEPVEQTIETVENTNEENNVEVNPFVDLPPVTPFNYEQTEETTVEPVEQTIETVEQQNLNKGVLEHPDAKITLKNEVEEEISKKELDELKDVKLSDNSSLKFVLILGIILLAVIFLIPYLSEYIGM